MNEAETGAGFRVPRSSIPKQIRRARRREAIADGAVPPARPKFPKPVAVPAVSPEVARAEWERGFAARGWTAFAYQRDAWDAFARGESGLIVLPTGSGKTFAALGGPLISLRETGSAGRASELRILYVSPLKALVRDLEKSVVGFLGELGWRFRVETRTGDTEAGERRRQRENLPHLLITTPESLALLLTGEGWRDRFAGLEAIVIDEWHELLGSKRGSLLELNLARLRAAAPAARTWAVSATIADPELAARVATGGASATIVRDRLFREVEIDAILPDTEGDLPWFGHYGLRRVVEVGATLDPARTTLIFTNTRAQAERWFGALLALYPEWADRLALHHGSLDRDERARVEDGVKEGKLSFVVATSSLDLGVDFPTVERVIQIGSVKSVARATQRAGRAFHRPGETTRLTVCPTHFLEYVEVAALRRAVAAGDLEARKPREAPLDVLVQHVLSAGLGDGFRADELLAEIRSAYSYRGVTDAEFAWILDFATTGGSTLRAYPEFRKLVLGDDGRYRFAVPKLARAHRMNIGTIVGEAGVSVRFRRGAKLGQIDESFVTKLKPGEVFRFAGKTLELIQVRDLVAYVKAASGRETAATVWGGNALPISEGLSHPIREILGEVAGAADPELADFPAEVRALRTPLAIQRARSAIPAADETLVERLKSRDGYHLFVYTWEGRSVNEGLGHLLAYRLARNAPNTIAVSANDHGFECLAVTEFPGEDAIAAAFATVDLEADVAASLNYPEMAKRAFREIARVAGLVHTTTPGERKGARHLQMSSSLLFDVFRNYDPGHPLLGEAYREVNRAQLELPRLRALLDRIARGRFRFTRPGTLTPFAFPLYVDRVRSRLSTESLADRIERMQKRVFAP